ncbi:hypothetical protein BJ741DRAFT_610536 [Chytriomyces cf. hyalinus JEL632]|nr:hypothetical protein BJ741DRAFT_610536 [Chytriomyces cf. hyalinus JEL632]
MSFPVYHPNDFAAAGLMDRRFSLPDFDYLSHQQQQPVFEYDTFDRRMSMPLGSSLQQFHCQSYAGMVSEGQRMFTNQDTRNDSKAALNIPQIGETFELLTPISLPASETAAENVVEPGTSRHLFHLINKPEPGLELVMALPPNAFNSPDTSETTTSRFKPTPAQLEFLMRVFEKNPFPSTALCAKIGATMQRDAKNVRFWFQNRRATLKLKGVHAVKPKRGRGRTSSTVGKKIVGMAPVSGSGFFYSRV